MCPSTSSFCPAVWPVLCAVPYLIKMVALASVCRLLHCHKSRGKLLKVRVFAHCVRAHGQVLSARPKDQGLLKL